MVRRILTFVSLMLLIAGTATAQSGPVKIGLLLPYTGPLGIQGVEATKGFELYMNKLGMKAGGRAIQVVKEDTEAKPDVGLTKIKKLIESDKVDFVVGPVSSVVALAIRNYVNDQGVPLIVPVAFSRALTAPPQTSPSIFRIIETTDQANYPMGAWMMKNTKYRKVIIMATDFVAGRDSVLAFAAGFKAAGGQIVKEIYAPLGASDFAPYLAEAADTKADAVYAFFPGADAIHFVKQYKEYGLFEKLPLTGYNVLTDDTLLPAIGDAAVGIVTVGGWSATLNVPESKAFVADYQRAYKDTPTRYAAHGYESAQLIAATIDTLKGNLSDRNKVKDTLKTTLPKLKTPRGHLEFDASRQVIPPVFVMRADKQGNRIVNTIIQTIPPVPQEKVWAGG